MALVVYPLAAAEEPSTAEELPAPPGFASEEDLEPAAQRARSKSRSRSSSRGASLHKSPEQVELEIRMFTIVHEALEPFIHLEPKYKLQDMEKRVREKIRRNASQVMQTGADLSVEAKVNKIVENSLCRIAQRCESRVWVALVDWVSIFTIQVAVLFFEEPEERKTAEGQVATAVERWRKANTWAIQADQAPPPPPGIPPKGSPPPPPPPGQDREESEEPGAACPPPPSSAEDLPAAPACLESGEAPPAAEEASTGCEPASAGAASEAEAATAGAACLPAAEEASTAGDLPSAGAASEADAEEEVEEQPAPVVVEQASPVVAEREAPLPAWVEQAVSPPVRRAVTGSSKKANKLTQPPGGVASNTAAAATVRDEPLPGARPQTSWAWLGDSEKPTEDAAYAEASPAPPRRASPPPSAAPSEAGGEVVSLTEPLIADPSSSRLLPPDAESRCDDAFFDSCVRFWRKEELVGIHLSQKSITDADLHAWCQWAMAALPRLGATGRSDDRGAPAPYALSIDMSNNYITGAGLTELVRTLTRKLRSVRVHDLRLHKNRLGPDAAAPICELISHMGRKKEWRAAPEELHLSHNNLGAHGIQAVLESVASAGAGSAHPTYPLQIRNRARRPLWLRVEFNGQPDVLPEEFARKANERLIEIRRENGWLPVGSTAPLLCLHYYSKQGEDRRMCTPHVCARQQGEEGPIAHLNCWGGLPGGARESSASARVMELRHASSSAARRKGDRSVSRRRPGFEDRGRGTSHAWGGYHQDDGCDSGRPWWSAARWSRASESPWENYSPMQAC